MPRTDDSVWLAGESAFAGVIVCDETGVILFANRQAEATFGYGAAELVGLTIGALVPTAETHGGGSRPFWEQPLWQSDAECTLSGRRKDGSHGPVAFSVSVIARSGGRIAIVSIGDATKQGELEKTPTSVEQAGFERLLTDLTARFVMVGADALDAAIIDSLRQIAEMLGVERGTWWRVNAEQDAVVTHSWTHPEHRVMQLGDSAHRLVPWLFSRLSRGLATSYSSVDDVPNAADRLSFRRFQAKSGIAVPFMANREFKAILGFSAIRAAREWSPEITERLQLFADVIGQALLRKESEEQLQSALTEVRELRDRLALENVQLRREARTPSHHRLVVVAESAATRRVLEQIEAVAATNATVLLLGETGTGKEVFAHAIHRASEWHRRPMVTVNCAAIPAALIESELFGRERGAYTGAIARQIGRFEMANDSTIFLDEVGELPLEAQVKLLRVLQERVIERLGGGQPVKVNVRIIAATNRNLEKSVADKTFREDLFYRLNVFPITIPPLRERVADISALVWTFIEEYSEAFKRPIDSISKDSLANLQQYSWPGNVRQLRNVIERAVIVARSPHLVIDDLPAVPESGPSRSTRLADIEAEQIRAVLEEVGWRVRGTGGAAERLGLKPTTLDSRMAKLGIRRPASL